MNRVERAKQFLPFDALKGLKEELESREEKMSRVPRHELTEERAEDDYFCGSDTVQYFSKEIRFLCGVSLVENIRKEMYTYVGVDMEIKK